jgi:hypothetical protein
MINATQRRLNELEWAMARLLRAPREVRRSKRQFGVAMSTDGGMTFTNVYPVDISVDGVALITTQEIKQRRILVTIDLDNKRIQALAQCVTAQKGLLKGNIVWRIGTRFIQIAREDRMMIDRFIKRLPLTAAPKPQQQYGMFPENVTRKILEELVALERLSPLRHGKQPLVKMTHAGVIQRAKQTMHSVKIESRVVREGTTTVYTTQAYVSDRLTRIELVPMDNGRLELIVPTALRRPSAAPKLPWQRLFAS